MAVNIFLTGVAYQGGLIPISLEAMEKAIELNGVDIERNMQAFSWGRKYYEDAAWVESFLASETKQSSHRFDRVAELREYQNAAYAQTYVDFLEKIGEPSLREVVAKYLYKLMAYKDEYEVARLLTKPEFERRALDMWAAPESISYNLHPPLLRSFGVHKKLKLGSWFRTPLLVLKRFKGLRGTPFDIFGYAAHRRHGAVADPVVSRTDGAGDRESDAGQSAAGAGDRGLARSDPRVRENQRTEYREGEAGSC